MSTTNILDLNNRIDKIEKAGIGTAAETSYSNTTSGLSATNVQAAIDEIDGVTDNLSSAITDIEGDILAIEGDVEDLEKEKVDWTSEEVLGAKNLLVYPYYETTRTDQDVTFTDNGDGTIKVNGTNSSASSSARITLMSRLQGLSFPLETGKTYILNGCPSGGGSTTYRIWVGVYKDNSWVVDKSDEGNGVEFTIPEGAAGITINIEVRPGATADNLIFSPMLRLVTVTDDNYVPYAMTNKALTDIVKCSKTVAGTYNLTATVDSNGGVTYEWVLDS